MKKKICIDEEAFISDYEEYMLFKYNKSSSSTSLKRLDTDTAEFQNWQRKVEEDVLKQWT